MKLKMIVLALAAAALTASAAIAAPPAGKNKNKPATTTTTTTSTNAAKPTVSFILHGTLTGYTPVNGTTNGSVTLTVSKWNQAGKRYLSTSLKGVSLTFVIAPGTNVVLHNGAAPLSGDKVIVKVRATKASASSLTSASSISQLIDQGQAS